MLALLALLLIIALLLVVLVHAVLAGSGLEGDGGGSNVSVAGEPDSVLGDLDLDALAQLLEISDDALELGGGKLDLGVVDGVGNAEVLLVDVHELHLVLSDAVVLCGWKVVSAKVAKQLR